MPCNRLVADLRARSREVGGAAAKTYCIHRATRDSNKRGTTPHWATGSNLASCIHRLSSDVVYVGQGFCKHEKMLERWTPSAPSSSFRRVWWVSSALIFEVVVWELEWGARVRCIWEGNRYRWLSTWCKVLSGSLVCMDSQLTSLWSTVRGPLSGGKTWLIRPRDGKEQQMMEAWQSASGRYIIWWVVCLFRVSQHSGHGCFIDCITFSFLPDRRCRKEAENASGVRADIASRGTWRWAGRYLSSFIVVGVQVLAHLAVALRSVNHRRRRADGLQLRIDRFQGLRTLTAHRRSTPTTVEWSFTQRHVQFLRPW